jgi:hypothetical protein
MREADDMVILISDVDHEWTKPSWNAHWGRVRAHAMEKRRINTQLPRRTKVRTATPMTSEWDMNVGSPPSGLRTPSNKMMPGSTNKHAPTDTSMVKPKNVAPRLHS